VQFKTNLHCGSCLRSATPFLEAIENLPAWSVDLGHPDRILTVESEDAAMAEAIVSALEEAGFEASLV
jgi:copper chaperone